MTEATEDEKAFGINVFVYCRQHMRPHVTGWCTVHVDQKVPLLATTIHNAIAECRARGFALFDDLEGRP